jgi:ABC-type transport system involved in cytochrome c biogenesis ATPase subunit
MYESYYGLSGKPFQLNPDPAFFFGSRGHNRAFAYLQYGLYQGEGFIVITGEIGAGKTTIVRSLFEQLKDAGLTFSHRLTPITSANATLGWLRTTATDDSSLRSTTSYALASISSSLAAKTGVSAGVNYYIFDSITGGRSDSLGIFAAVTHNF